MAETYLGIAHPFPPVVDAQSRVLVLGTFPSVQSRKNEFYYGHPQNRFWHVLAILFQSPMPETVQQKQIFLLTHGIALWDVLASCDITGSADGSIRHPIPNDIAALVATYSIGSIYCNGQTSSALYKRWCEPLTGKSAISLPSTSPANATWSVARLVEAWQPLYDAIQEA